MKEQYVGDVNDYRKYALVRALCGYGQLAAGVCWMLTPPDNRSDGNKIHYLKKPAEHEVHDSTVFNVLQRAISEPVGRRIRYIETCGLISNAKFFSEVLPDSSHKRESYFKRMQAHFADVDLVFFDPDNGLQVPSKPKGSPGSSKYIFLDEIAATFQGRRSVLIYQHFPREKRSDYIKRTRGKLADIAWGASVYAFATPNVLFVLLSHPKHAEHLSNTVQTLKTKWPGTFLRCVDN